MASTAVNKTRAKPRSSFIAPPTDFQILPPQPKAKSTARRRSENVLASLSVAPLQPAPGPSQRRSEGGQGPAAALGPPNRLQENIQEKTALVYSREMLGLQAKMPRKDRKSASRVDPRVLQQLRISSSVPDMSALRGRPSTLSGAPTGLDPMSHAGSIDGPPLVSGAQAAALPIVLQKHNKSEVEDYYAHLKGRRFKLTHVVAPSATGSVSSRDFGSTISSAASESAMAMYADDGPPAMSWVPRWKIDKVGKAPGQIKCVKDVCVTRGAGQFLAITDSKNSRVQMFSTNSGRLLAVLGVDSEDSRTSKSFMKYSHRRMQPSGICETTDGALLVVTDLNRLLYIDTSSQHGELQAELVLKNRQKLSGVAVTQASKLIVSELGTKPSVGLFEAHGTVIREFKGTFKTPSYVAWSEEYETAAVSDGEQQCVLIYDSSGKALTRFGRGCPVEAPLSYPAGICWLTDTRLLVADRAENRVLAIDLRNCSVEDVLTEADGLRHPVALATNRRDRIVLTEEFYDFGEDKYQVKMFALRPTGGGAGPAGWGIAGADVFY